MQFGAFNFPTFADEATAQTFFAVYQRFEYTLKKERFSTGNDKVISANWDIYADEIDGFWHNSKKLELEQAITYIFNVRPLKETRDVNGNPDWTDVKEPKDDLKSLFVYIRRIRNNLFHGGKSQDHSLTQTARNTKLLSSALIILEECLAFCRDELPHFVASFEEMA